MLCHPFVIGRKINNQQKIDKVITISKDLRKIELVVEFERK